MPIINFRCPHCAADLKIRDDQIAASPVSCPDCRKPIFINRDEFGNVAAAGKAPDPDPPRHPKIRKRLHLESPPHPESPKKFRR